MKFINTGTILISTNTIKTIEVVGARDKGGYAVYINEHKQEQQARQAQEAEKKDKPITDKEAADFAAYLKGEGIDEAFILATYKVKDLKAIPRKQVEQMCDRKNLELLKSNYEKWAK